MAEETTYTAEERLYLDEAGRVVKQDRSEKRTLLAGVGQTIPAARAKELGLIKAGKAEAKPEPEGEKKAESKR